MPESEALETSQDDAATKIQSAQRGKKGREEAKEKKRQGDAATKIQKRHRGNKGRRKAKAKQEEEKRGKTSWYLRAGIALAMQLH